jgi:hypothetical protein
VPVRTGGLRSLRCGKYVGGPPTQPFATGILHMYLIGPVDHRSRSDVRLEKRAGCYVIAPDVDAHAAVLERAKSPL